MPRHSFPCPCRDARPGWRQWAAAALAALLAACAQAPGAGKEGAAELALALPRHPMVLLGEVHDNADGHTLRLRAIADAVEAGWRPAIAMEQFDREHQAVLDRAMKTCADAACVIQAAAPGKAGWNWDYYKPVIDLALRNHLPLIAANLSRADAGRVMQEGMAAVFTAGELRELGLEQGPDPALLQAQAAEVAQAHCGMLPAALHKGMAAAQIARDAMMALQMRRAASPGASAARQLRPVVLLAGNGHVRRDQGVPRWLDRGAALSVGFTEGAAPAGWFDRDIVISPAQRPDPCASLRGRPFGRPAGN
ncbi:ChaN family lipoprotein [Pollutimonas bauzanensis]|uniref:Haem-binding uptake, Tiki superfamily, ChaN n=1 Tax=Pollutimonas bauzanensis TaxID=658167 RepID=A0A1M5ZJH0_9BURK|nr:ChaN family lipoprotein [Pollutimonas bauzanensis]SHI24312.1 Haem-binding uptake, Tiki superfamily, ChaN [Pollutimonas bauzanensis]